MSCLSDYVLLLRCKKYVEFSAFSDTSRLYFEALVDGSHVLHTHVDEHPLALAVWKGARTLSPYASREQRIHQLRMCAEDTSEMGSCRLVVTCPTNMRVRFAENELAIARKTGGRSSTLTDVQQQADKCADDEHADEDGDEEVHQE
jgi:hypothetical protein